MTKLNTLIAILLVMTAAVIPAACGGDDGGQMDGMGDMGGDGGNGMMDGMMDGGNPQGSGVTLEPDASGIVTAIAGDNFFEFGELRIDAGQQVTVRLVNEGRATHDFMLHTEAGEPLLDGSGKEIATPFVPGGEQGEVSFSLPPGVYGAMCGLHPREMQAAVIVS